MEEGNDGKLDRIGEAIGFLRAAVAECNRSNARLEQQFDAGLKRLELSFEKAILDIRNRYHEQHNEVMGKMLKIENAGAALGNKISALEDWKSEQTGAMRASKIWIAALASVVATGVSWLIDIFTGHR